MHGNIVQLPDAVANQIAAGEVVERPVAVVKELVENALDAEAQSIEIQFERGGKSLIRVLDDGIGMSREDALMALRRHATSKIRDVGDILQISSFGFRGEALPSIASVSNFNLRTRRTDSPTGTDIRVNGGGDPVVSSCGMPPGTEVTVASLFHSVPARRKFMKTDRTESAHILQMCRLLAIAHPEVGFSLVEDGHEVFRSPTCPSRADRVREIFGKRRVEDLIDLQFEKDGIRVTGLIGRPGTGRSTRAEMITYVNHRPVESRLLNYALIESYHRYLPRGRYPMAFLFVDLPAGDVDVNVHPTKREVRFRAEPVVRNVVMSGLVACLQKASDRALGEFSPADPLPDDREEKKAVPQPKVLPPLPQPRQPFQEIRDIQPAPAPAPFRQPAAQPAESPTATACIWQYCGVFRGNIGLFESADGLVLLNAKAARERILFERFLASLEGEAIPMQPMLLPPMLELSPIMATILKDQLEFFENLGFEIEPFGRNLFRIRSIPVWIQGDQPESFVEELLQKIRDRGLRPDDVHPARTAVARMAAIREARGFTVRDEEGWEMLARTLLNCSNPLLDARGRPAFVEIRNAELARKLMLDGSVRESDILDGPG
jgi:DNA mismatch repair protein MutL